MSWQFRTYTDESGHSDVEQKYQGDPEIQAALDTKLEMLEQLSVDKWRRPWTEQLKGNCDGLVAIRFKAGKVEQRLIGFFGPDQSFTFVYWAFEKNGKYQPKGCCGIAQERKRTVQKNPKRSREFKFES